MSEIHDVDAFIGAVNRVASLRELGATLDDMASELGFDHYALVHHVDLSTVRDGVVRLSNYPQGWIEHFLEQRYFIDDPVLAACDHTGRSFAWADLPKMIRMTSRQQEILKGGERAGLAQGMTVPIHLPGEQTGSCSFAAASGRVLRPATLFAAHSVGGFAFEAARRLVRHGQIEASAGRPEPPRLTTRQLDCLTLVAQGKSDWSAAQILGLSRETVHWHIQNAMRRYGVSTRQQLIVRALFDRQLTFTDLLS